MWNLSWAKPNGKARPGIGAGSRPSARPRRLQKSKPTPTWRRWSRLLMPWCWKTPSNHVEPTEELRLEKLRKQYERFNGRPDASGSENAGTAAKGPRRAGQG